LSTDDTLPPLGRREGMCHLIIWCTFTVDRKLCHAMRPRQPSHSRLVVVADLAEKWSK